ncbi:MAG: hypothetical protein ABIF77_12450 [bacterium]
MGKKRNKLRRGRRAAERVMQILDRVARKAGGRLGSRRRAAQGGSSREVTRRRSGRRSSNGTDHTTEREAVRYLTIIGNEALFAEKATIDFEHLRQLPFAASPTALQLLLPQSVLGRAQNGHGWFADEYGTPLIFRDATFDRILTVLERTWPDLHSNQVRQGRSRLVEHICDMVLSQLDQPRLTLDGPDGPPFGIQFLAGREVETKPFLQGMVLAGCMDDLRQREMALAWHRRTFAGAPYELGGGEIRVVDAERMLRTGIVDPGRVPFGDEEIQTLEQLGVLQPDDADRLWTYPQYDQAYFRRRAGEGVCDDLALIYVGARFGFAAMLGAFLMDAIDTYDKYLWEFRSGGMDSYLTARIQQHFQSRTGETLVSGEAILDLIHFAAKNNHPNCFLSSSHRRLIQTERKAAQPTVLHHWRYLAGESLAEIELGFARMPARDFYDIATARLLAVGFEVPTARFGVS